MGCSTSGRRAGRKARIQRKTKIQFDVSWTGHEPYELLRASCSFAAVARLFCFQRFEWEDDHLKRRRYS
jgi:hypothetical protein